MAAWLRGHHGDWRYRLLAPALDYAMRAPGLLPEQQAAQGQDEGGRLR